MIISVINYPLCSIWRVHPPKCKMDEDNHLFSVSFLFMYFELLVDEEWLMELLEPQLEIISQRLIDDGTKKQVLFLFEFIQMTSNIWVKWYWGFPFSSKFPKVITFVLYSLFLTPINIPFIILCIIFVHFILDSFLFWDWRGNTDWIGQKPMFSLTGGGYPTSQLFIFNLILVFGE